MRSLRLPPRSHGSNGSDDPIPRLLAEQSPVVLHQRIHHAASANCAGLQNVIAGFSSERPTKVAIVEREIAFRAHRRNPVNFG
jgi:hypothetical protein